MNDAAKILCRPLVALLISLTVVLILAASPPASAAPIHESPIPADEADASVAPGEESVPLIPRQVLFGNPDRAAPRLSSDGARFSFLAPVEGVLNVWVGPSDDPSAARPVTNDRGRGIRSYFWAFTNSHIVYLQDKNGDENWRAYSVDLATGQTRDLTPLEGVRAEVNAASPQFPDEVLVGLNDRDPQFHDLYRVNVRTGERRLIQENPGFAGFDVDDEFRVRLAGAMTPEGGMDLFQPEGDGGWKPFDSILAEDLLTTATIGFDRSGRTLYMTDSRGRNTAALVAVDMDTGQARVLAEDPRADVEGAGSLLRDPGERRVQAVAFNYLRQEWQALDPAIEPDLEFLRNLSPGDFQVMGRTLDDRRWIVQYMTDDGPVRSYLYDRPARQATLLFINRRALEGLPLAPMHPVVIQARDGLEMVSYLTLPVDTDPEGSARPDHPLPMVLLVHGGPWARDEWGYQPEHQLLANRGYAVLSVNYRGSTGFGKEFANAAIREWGGKMHDDLVDAVGWAVSEGIADPDRVAIFGGSYGGYATLVGLTFTPDLFAAGVDIVGPSNLVTLLNSIPPYWAPVLEMFKTRVGDPTTEEGRAFLEERSPLTHVDRIQRPLLIGQGANDPRVKQAESDQIVEAMQQKGIPVTYVLYPDEGHGFARPENNLSFYAVAEHFLSAHLGGRTEPIGEDLAGSSITVPVGAEEIPGLAEVLAGQ